MNREEIASLMDTLMSLYPGYYNPLSKQQKAKAFAVWANSFVQEDADQAAAGLHAFINTSSSAFPPTIGQVKEQMRLLFESDEDSAQEAWNAVYMIIHTGCSPAKYEALPPLAKKAVGSYGQLKSMGQMSEDQLNNAGKNSFLNLYKLAEKRQRAIAALPDSMKSLIAAALPAGGET